MSRPAPYFIDPHFIQNTSEKANKHKHIKETTMKYLRFYTNPLQLSYICPFLL